MSKLLSDVEKTSSVQLVFVLYNFRIVLSRDLFLVCS